MSSGIPIVRQIAWISFVPHILVVVLLCSIWYQFDTNYHILGGSVLYVILSRLLKRFIAKDQQKGMVQVRKEKFAEAIPFFEKSYQFFTKHKWIDRFRYVTLLSSSRMTCREIALVNTAFCYSQIGEGEKARKYYERAHEEFPDSSIAKTTLNLFNSIEKADADPKEENE